METPKTIEDILKDPEAIKALLKNVEVQKMMPRITPSSSEKTKKEGIKTTKKYDRYEQFNGILITVTHKRIKEGWKTFSIRANGRSVDPGSSPLSINLAEGLVYQQLQFSFNYGSLN